MLARIRHILSFALVLWMLALPVFAAEGLQNPLKFDTVDRFVEGFLRAIVMIAIPLITIFIVYSGFLFISARGKPGQLNEAKQNFMYVILGAILLLSAWVLATLIGGTVRQLLG